MKKSQAKQTNQVTHELNKKDEIPKLDINYDIVNRVLTSNAEYPKEDITVTAQCLMLRNGLKMDQATVFESVPEFEQFLKGFNAENGVFVLLKHQENRWVAMSILKSQNSITILYKDASGTAIPENIKRIVKEKFTANQVIFKDHRNSELVNGTVTGYLALKNFEIIVMGLKMNKVGFINGFSATKFSVESQIDLIRKDFGECLKDLLMKGFSEVVVELANDVEFMIAVKELIEKCLKYKNAFESAKIYSELLMNEMMNFKENEKWIFENKNKIDEAKINFLNNSDVKEIVDREGANVDKDYKLGVIKKFPEQMKKFTELFQILANSKADDKLEITLKYISKKFGIDFEKIKQFFVFEKIEAAKIEAVAERIDDKSYKKQTDAMAQFQGRPPRTDPEIKSLQQLLFEMKIGKDDGTIKVKDPSKENKDYYSNDDQKKELESQFATVKRYFEQWKNKSPEQVNKWAREKRGNLRQYEVLESIAVMDRGNQLVTEGHLLRDAQILSILVFLQSQPNQGKLCQIQTGEGKTYIISFLVVLRVLQGQQIDIITSNQVLAQDGVVDRINFYNLFGVTATTNNIDINYKGGARSCYSFDVVYGNIGNFQFDYLRHTFEGHGTRGTRNFGSVILDEVDSILVDNGGYIAKLAEPFPGIDALKYAYINIWVALHKAEEELYADFEKMMQQKGAKLGDITDKSEEEKQLEYETYFAQLLSMQMDLIKNKIKASKPTEIDLIPIHLREYARDMEEKWIDNAIFAKYKCNENEQYVIKKKGDEDAILPVDYQNTGVTLRNTIWSNGLHQFVQLKHNLQLTSESLTSCFISNIGFIKLYENRIWGLTGTLGSLAEQELLSTTYNVDYAKITTYKDKKFVKWEGAVVEDEQWANYIAIDNFMLAKEGRSVLIICKTIQEVKDLEENIVALKTLEGFDELKIKIYPDDDSSKNIRGKVGVSEIIIATNIAGRGTDLKTKDDLEKNGGIHVCVSFLPVNQRVQDQAFGRTARQGKSGTAQLVIKESEILQYRIQFAPDLKFNDIVEKRDEAEKNRLDQIKNVELQKINFQDKIFSKFSALYVSFKSSGAGELGRMFLAKDLKEFWAFWLRKKDFDGKSDLSSIEAEFKNFKKDAAPILGGKITHNPYYSISLAELLLDNDRVEEAKNALNRAIELSQENASIMASAYLKNFEIEILEGKQVLERFKKAIAKVFFVNVDKNENYKQNAKSALQKANNALKREIAYLTGFFENENGFKNIVVDRENNYLIKHTNSRIVALNTFQMHVESLLDQIKSSSNDDGTKGLALNSRVPDYLKKLDEKKPSEKKLKDVISNTDLAELELIGLETIYSLKEVHDVPEKVIIAAQAQIGGGIAVLAAGIAFPPSLPILGQIAGALISEGICDIILELISQGDHEYSEEAYVKGKCISYGIAIATMGLSAIASSIKMLNAVAKACRGLAKLVSKCPVFKTVCAKLAIHINKLALYFEKLVLKASSKVVTVTNLSRKQLMTETLKNVGKETLQDVVFSVVSEKIVTRILQESLTNYKPIIEKVVKATIEHKVDKQLLRCNKVETVYEVSTNIITGTYGEITGDILKEIALGILRHSKNWKAKIASISMDTAISSAQIVQYAESYCIKLNEQLRSRKAKRDVELVNNDDEAILDMKENITQQVTNKVYELIIYLMGKYAHTFMVAPIMNKVWGKVWSENKKQVEEEESKHANKLQDILEAQKLLGLDKNATEAEIRSAYRKMAVQTHPDRNQSDPEAHQNFIRIKEAYDLLIDVRAVLQSTPTTKEEKILTLDFIDTEKNKAHKGNIITLSETLEQTIIVKKQGKLYEFGSKFKDNGKEPIVVEYIPRNKDQDGHFDIPSDKKGQIVVKSTGKNNCFYDAAAAILLSRGNPTSSQTLRKIAEQPNSDNRVFGSLNVASRVLKNPLTINIYVKAQNALLVGGARRPVPIREDHYPSHGNVIKVNATCVQVVTQLRNELHTLQEDEWQFNPRDRTSIGSRLIKKKEMMLGALEVEFTNGEILRKMTVSGDAPVNTGVIIERAPPVEGIEELNVDAPRGFVLIGPEKPTGQKIYDVMNRRLTDEVYERSCAAQKLIYDLGKFMQNEGRGYVIKNINMAEAWYDGTVTSNNKDAEVVIEASCQYCTHVLPIATGSRHNHQRGN